MEEDELLEEDKRLREVIARMILEKPEVLDVLLERLQSDDFVDEANNSLKGEKDDQGPVQ